MKGLQRENQQERDFNRERETNTEDLQQMNGFRKKTASGN